MNPPARAGACKLHRALSCGRTSVRAREHTAQTMCLFPYARSASSTSSMSTRSMGRSTWCPRWVRTIPRGRGAGSPGQPYWFVADAHRGNRAAYVAPATAPRDCRLRDSEGLFASYRASRLRSCLHYAHTVPSCFPGPQVYRAKEAMEDEYKRLGLYDEAVEKEQQEAAQQQQQQQDEGKKQ